MIITAATSDYKAQLTHDELVAEFARLAAAWDTETKYLSNTVQIAMSEPYQQIIALGRPVVPLILRDLRTRPRQWFWALRAITQVNPVPPDDRGQVRKMADAWIAWGERQGLIAPDRP